MTFTAEEILHRSEETVEQEERLFAARKVIASYLDKYKIGNPTEAQISAVMAQAILDGRLSGQTVRHIIRRRRN